MTKPKLFAVALVLGLIVAVGFAAGITGANPAASPEMATLSVDQMKNLSGGTLLQNFTCQGGSIVGVSACYGHYAPGDTNCSPVTYAACIAKQNDYCNYGVPVVVCVCDGGSYTTPGCNWF